MDTVPKQFANLTVKVPQAVYDGLAAACQSNAPMDSPNNLPKALTKLGHKEAASWVADNLLLYGQGYYHGFIPENVSPDIAKKIVPQEVMILLHGG